MAMSALAVHVKWFSDFSYADQPLTIGRAVTPLVGLLAVFSAVVIGLLVLLDRRLGQTDGYVRINEWLESRRDQSLTVLRIAAAAALLLAWQAGILLVPELEIGDGALGWVQFLIVLLLLVPRTVPVAGAAIIALYLAGLWHFGVFHMLDYLVYAGAGWMLMVSSAGSEKVRGTGIPALYVTVGFSLCWVALEKLIYPQWGIHVLQQHPQLTMGFDVQFFLVGAAFVEFALGYLLIIGLLERPLALTITLVFFTTTMVFGKVEVIGHTLIHGALIVFLLEGPGRVYPAPVRFHSRMPLRVAFAAVNFLVLFVLMLIPYAWAAWQRYESVARAAGQ